LETVIPANTTATVWVPAADAGQVTESDRPATQSPGVKFQRVEAGCAVFTVGSGRYHFRSVRSEK
jgi:hypothetical protein